LKTDRTKKATVPVTNALAAADSISVQDLALNSETKKRAKARRDNAIELLEKRIKRHSPYLSNVYHQHAPGC